MSSLDTMTPPVGSFDPGRRLRGGLWGPLLVLAFVAVVAVWLYSLYVAPDGQPGYGDKLRFHNAMFGPALEQPIPFSHRLHATDKQIDCQYCHPYPERSLNAGMPSVATCLGCHDHIIPEHQEIQKVRQYRDRGEELPWLRVYYNPDHVFFPHMRHHNRGVACQECHGDVQNADRLRQVTFYMGFCIGCHRERKASVECTACHQ